MLKGKTVVLGVTGSIAAYKIANLASMLVKQHCDVHVIMTKNATNFINPIAFETLTNNKCLVDTFDRNFQYSVEHVSLAKKADLFLVAPASANFIGKAANGIADDMLTTTVMACTCPIYLSPAMNTAMYQNPITQDNMAKLKRFGYHIIEAASGLLACGDTGIGKMPEPEVLAKYADRELKRNKDLVGKKILVTAGATCEPIDPVRYITNHSSGKMGCAIAKTAMERGAEVTLVCGSMTVEPPMFVNVVKINTAEEMFNAVKENFDNTDIVIKAAAVADYTPTTVANNKIKKADGDMSIPLKRTTDILKYLGENKTHQFLCGFSMETENMLENSTKKLSKKNLDMVVANNLKDKGAGFGTDTNLITIITKDNVNQLPLMPKEDVANSILDEILKNM